MAYIDKQSVIDVIKKRKPQFASGLTDEQIYKWAADNLDPGKISGGKANAFRPWSDEKYSGLALKRSPFRRRTRNKPKNIYGFCLRFEYSRMDWRCYRYKLSKIRCN